MSKLVNNKKSKDENISDLLIQTERPGLSPFGERESERSLDLRTSEQSSSGSEPRFKPLVHEPWTESVSNTAKDFYDKHGIQFINVPRQKKGVYPEFMKKEQRTSL